MKGPDDDDFYVLLFMLLRRRRRRRIKTKRGKRKWVREIFKVRKLRGHYHTLLQEMRLN